MGQKRADPPLKALDLWQMDTRTWDITQLNSNLSLKRSWNSDSMTTAAATLPPPHLLSQPHDTHIQDSEGAWKRRRSSPVSARGGWDTSLQTSLWLAQQNTYTSVDSMRKNPIQPQDKEHGSILPKDEPVPTRPGSSWSAYTEDVAKAGDQVRQSSLVHLTSQSSPEASKFGQRHSTAESHVSRQDEKEPTGSKPRKPIDLSTIMDSCHSCSKIEPLIQDAVNNVTLLLSSLSSGALLEIYSQYYRDGVGHNQMPQMDQLHRIFDCLEEASQIAKKLHQDGDSFISSMSRETSPKERDVIELSNSLEAMKKRFLTGSQSVLKRQRRDSSVSRGLESSDYQSGDLDNSSNDPSRRQSIASALNSERLPPILSNATLNTPPENLGFKLPSMNPPPTPGRQLPSPPGRTHASPPLYQTGSPASMSHSVLPPPSAPPQPPLQHLQHPLSPAPSSSLTASGAQVPTAVAAHTAALQHEVSLKSYALQTLQSEHDKLLAALGRSQTRARALEEKQVAADSEVNTLSEERIRLMERITELEAMVEDVGRARDDFRMAAVKEGKQYVEMIRMASRLEVMAGKERRKLKEALSSKSPAGSVAAEPSSLGTGSSPNTSSSEFRALELEMQQLRLRCSEFENALRNIKTENRRIDEVIAALGSASARVGKSIDGALNDKATTPFRNN